MLGTGGHPSAMSPVLSGLRGSQGQVQLQPSSTVTGRPVDGTGGQRTARIVTGPPSTGFFGCYLCNRD